MAPFNNDLFRKCNVLFINVSTKVTILFEMWLYSSCSTEVQSKLLTFTEDVKVRFSGEESKSLLSWGMWLSLDNFKN